MNTVDELIEKLRTHSGTWIGDVSARRMLAEFMAKGGIPSETSALIVRASLIRWIDFLRNLNDHVASGCETHRKMATVIEEMERSL